jgi:RNA polymerase sigma-B factor
MFARMACLPLDDPRRGALRDRLVEMHLPLVRSFVYRYIDRGEPTEDLLQVGAMGLVKAVDRFDPDRGVEFATFAGPTILGEIRRHFRDYTWAIHVDRGLRDLALETRRCHATLSQELGRAPTMAELAGRVGQPRRRVLDAVACYASRSISSLDAAAGGETPLSERTGGDEPAFDSIEMHESLGPLLVQLSDREQRILQLRFFGNRTQAQIAECLGISQMHVSRLLSRTLHTLRTELTADV